MKKEYSFGFLELNNLEKIKDYEIIIFINNKKVIDENFLIPKLNELVENIVRKDLLSDRDIKYLITNIDRFKDKTKEEIEATDYFIYIKAIDKIIHLKIK